MAHEATDTTQATNGSDNQSQTVDDNIPENNNGDKKRVVLPAELIAQLKGLAGKKQSKVLRDVEIDEVIRDAIQNHDY